MSKFRSRTASAVAAQAIYEQEQDLQKHVPHINFDEDVMNIVSHPETETATPTQGQVENSEENPLPRQVEPTCFTRSRSQTGLALNSTKSSEQTPQPYPATNIVKAPHRKPYIQSQNHSKVVASSFAATFKKSVNNRNRGCLTQSNSVLGIALDSNLMKPTGKSKRGFDYKKESTISQKIPL